TLFTVLTFGIAYFGLEQIINYSLPVLMFLYPLSIAIIILPFTSPLFKHNQIVYFLTIIITFLLCIIDGFKTLCETLDIDYYIWLIPIINVYEQYLPMYEEGLDCFVPFMIVLIILTIVIRIFNLKKYNYKF